MGKRSNFDRIPRDFYPTPAAAVAPLVPHLVGIRTFAEPCAGAGDLVRHLESYGLRCVYQGDVKAGQDALTIDQYGDADAIITNPPWTRKLLHPLIEHFQRIAPVWLLLEFGLGQHQAGGTLSRDLQQHPADRAGDLDSGDHHARQGQRGLVPFRRAPCGRPDISSVSLGAGIVSRRPMQALRQALPAAAIRFPLLRQCLSPARVP